MTQFTLSSAQRAKGLVVDFVDDERGRGLVIENPNAPKPVKEISAADAAAQVAAGTMTLVDVRPEDERNQAMLNQPFLHLDEGAGAIEALAKDTPLAFICHHGGRSLDAAQLFASQGFTNVHNVAGGIDAWAREVDTSIPTY